MSDDALHTLAARAGLATVWHDVYGDEHQVAPETLRAVLASLDLDARSNNACRDAMAVLDEEDRALPPLVTGTAGVGLAISLPPGRAKLYLQDGASLDLDLGDQGDGRAVVPGIAQHGYHRLECGGHDVMLAVAPRRAYGIDEALAGRKGWGLATQVYSLRRDGDGGVGDFAALAQLARAGARHGADALAISPVHALFAAEPRHYSPYGPSSRMALNPVYAPVDAGSVSETDGLINWPAATALRYAALREAFARDRDDPSFRAFERDAPVPIRQHALFEALSADRLAAGQGRDWRSWPEALRDPSGPAVAEAARRLETEIGFHIYAQFRARAGLEAAQNAATGAGMAIGLIADLAVGADPAGSDAWGRPGEVLRGVSVGAPPDEFNRAGQGWGLTAFSPRGLRQSGFSALRDMLEAALAPTGGVRIDHAMGLARLWLVPDGASPAEGCYLRFPFEDMRRIVILESLRYRGIVLAEDLGTVPEGFRPALADAGIAGMSVLWFERDWNGFVPPSRWRADTVAMTTTHDLPTVAGWWRGIDISWRNRLGIAGEDETRRDGDRDRLWSACCASGSAQGAAPAAWDSDPVVDSVAAHLGTAAPDLAIMPVEDALALAEQPNIPGTIDQHPNWRRQMPVSATTMLDEPRVAARLARLAGARSRA